MTTNTTAEQDWSNWFDEDALNSKPIDWAYWVGKMPSLTAAQAACLMCLLDPAQYKNLDTNDEVEQAAHKIQRLAEAREYGPASPREWLDWADSNTIKVHPGFRNEVRHLPVVSETGKKDKHDEEWKVKARDRALEIIKCQKAKDLYPDQVTVADEIAREFRAAGVVGAGGKPLTGAYIKRHALTGISSAQGRHLSTSIR